MRQAAVETGRWFERRRRAAELEARWPFAAEVLGFYAALVEVQTSAFDAAREELASAADVVAFTCERVVPRVIEVSAARGPAALVGAVLERFHEGDVAELVRAWLRGDRLSAVERYLSGAATAPVLEALGPAASDACEGPRDERHCPVCGGLPQLSYFAPSLEDLVTAHRYLECARCATSWAYPRLTCAACGETRSERLLVYTEIGTAQGEFSRNIIKPGDGASPAAPAASARFPHMRIDSCRTCSQYLLNVDLSRDTRAVPLVDELAAIPLDLYAKELGHSKVVSNLMGF